MTDIVATWLFDLLGVIATILTVLPVIGIGHDGAYQTVTVKRLATRDVNEIVPQVKWSWTGISLLVLSIILKLVFQLLVDSKIIACSSLVLRADYLSSPFCLPCY